MTRPVICPQEKYGKRSMTITKHGSAHWKGSIREGHGTITTESGALQAVPYGFATRFEGKSGSNPEELLAAAHAACFSMALSLILGEAGLTAQSIHTEAAVHLDKTDTGFGITQVDLTLKADVPGATAEQFLALAEKAKAGCPVSKLFRADITLRAELEG
jgi:osmotically inducible protein OsmC